MSDDIRYDEKNEEPILKPNPKRFVLFPIKYNEVRCLISS